MQNKMILGGVWLAVALLLAMLTATLLGGCGKSASPAKPEAAAVPVAPEAPASAPKAPEQKAQDQKSPPPNIFFFLRRKNVGEI